MYATNSPVLAFVALSTLASAFPKPGMQGQTGKAVYAITNSPNNAVIAMPIMADGKLGTGVLTATLGQGAVAVNGTGQPAMSDTLISQSAVTVAGQHLFAVNAGSNTVSMMAISPNDPTKLHMVGKPADVKGTFPNTVTVSPKNNIVCVGTSGSKAGVSCGSFDEHRGIGEMRSISNFELGQTDPPSGPPNTVSHVFFSVDESMLFTTVKGNPAVNKTGFLSSVPVSMAANGDCEPMVGKEIRSSPNGTTLLFGSAPIPGSNNTGEIFITDPSFGAAVVSINKQGKLQTTRRGPIKGQMATCWSTISPATRSAWVADAAVNRLVEMSLMDASVVGEIDLRQTAGAMNPGMFDLRAAGNFVYALSTGNGTNQPAINVVDVKEKKLVQNAGLGYLGVRNTVMGMAVLL